MYIIGADPEVFPVDQNGQFISGHHFNCGTKENPLKTENGHVQVDGIALEFNVSPAGTSNEFVKNVKSVMNDLNRLVDSIRPGASLKAIPTAHVGREFLENLPEENRALGCNPDFNAYELMENPIPNVNAPFRTGSGHVHIGFCEPDNSLVFDFEHFMRCAKIARQMDFFLGLPSLEWDDDDVRRTLYGKPGAFRPKPYGMEYRVLSNKWVTEDNLIEYVFNQTMLGLTALDEGVDMYDIYGTFARDIILEGNRDWIGMSPEIAQIIY